MRAILIFLTALTSIIVGCSDGSDRHQQANVVDPRDIQETPSLPFDFLQSLALRNLQDPYDLPNPLLMEDGTPVEDAHQWWFERRPEIIALFETHIYGKIPKSDLPLRFEVLEQDDAALGGSAIRKQVRIHFGEASKNPSMDVLIYLPSNAQGPVPVFANLNFMGNHTVHTDPTIFLPGSWVPNSEERGVVDNIASEVGRGNRARRYPIEEMLARGYGLVTAYAGDLDPDFDDGFQNGIHPLFYQNGQAEPADDEWGAIGAWAWGLSRIMDYLEMDSDIDSHRVAVVGHSRLGKTALWAGAQDTRFSLVISNDSGAVGAALSRRAMGETVTFINLLFPHWFADNFLQYGDNEFLLPVDQHQLIALIAPRPVYVASAEEDAWADPLGEFESVLYASDVYRLLGREGISETEQPPVDVPITSIAGYHIRPGVHDLMLYDWQQFMNFADLHL